MYNRGILAENGAALAIREYKERKRKAYQEEMERQRQEQLNILKESLNNDYVDKEEISRAIREGKVKNIEVTKTYSEGNTKYGYCRSYSTTTNINFTDDYYEDLYDDLYDDWDDEDEDNDWYEEEEYIQDESSDNLNGDNNKQKRKGIFRILNK